MSLFNRGSYKKGGFNFDRFWFVVIYCKNDFLNFLKRGVLQSFSPKTQGFACKSGFVLEFWGVCMQLLKKYRSLGARRLLF